VVAEFSQAVTAHLNAFAQLKRYDTIYTAMTAGATEAYAADGAVAAQAYSATWQAAESLSLSVGAGKLTLEQALAQLPVLAWPEEGEQ
jgi:hypothetical protein